MNKNDSGKLLKLGFDQSFYKEYSDENESGFRLARVTAVHKSNFNIHTGETEMPAEVSGKFFYESEDTVKFPTTGDWVKIQVFDDNSFAIIHELLPRKTVLQRKDPGKNTQYQLLAANIDIAFLMQALDNDLNVNRIERYLVMVLESGIEPVILMSKSDLRSESEVQEMTEPFQRLRPGIRIFHFSNLKKHGFQVVADQIKAGKTYCLLGSSGVGKTTLLNNLLGDNRFDVNEVRQNDQKGRHTTTTRQLSLLPGGGIIIDTPGMREIAQIGVASGIEQAFDAITVLAHDCRYKDCSHIHETGCAVLEAVQKGTLDSAQYNNYVKIKKESDFYEMSYLDKRKRDKQFGKMVKQMMKNYRKK